MLYRHQSTNDVLQLWAADITTGREAVIALLISSGARMGMRCAADLGELIGNILVLFPGYKEWPHFPMGKEVAQERRAGGQAADGQQARWLHVHLQMHSPARACDLQLPGACEEGMGAAAGNMAREAHLVKSGCQVIGEGPASTCSSKGIGIRNCWGAPARVLSAPQATQ